MHEIDTVISRSHHIDHKLGPTLKCRNSECRRGAETEATSTEHVSFSVCVPMWSRQTIRYKHTNTLIHTNTPILPQAETRLIEYLSFQKGSLFADFRASRPVDAPRNTFD